ncbi:MAG TPA: DPP IV N-terminal domain-containing protein [Longimicrobiales bacterium]|nr:DPP IV N-terminal domain-containing protein [Longimicrobiales bacterium]
MMVRHARWQVLVLFAAVAPWSTLAGQQPERLTADDYARAERFLGQQVNPLVSGVAGPVTWLPDGRFWYRATTPAGADFTLVDPARGTRAAVFDQARLARALGTVTGGAVDPARLPFTTFDLSRDGRQATFTAGGRRWTCDIVAYACATPDTMQAAGGAALPPASVMSPDGRWAAFTRDHNLWVRDMRSGEDRALTTDGVEDFGYATNNAGWTRSAVPLVAWSPDSRRIFTFQQDARGIGHMYLVTTNVGTPELQQWRYPLPSDTVPFRIHRVVIDVEPARVTRLQMEPDAQRSTIYDHIAIGGRLVDVEWYPDGSHVAFVSTSRDAKEVAFRVADATTGAVRTLFTETSPTQFQGGFVAMGRENWRVLPAQNTVLWWSQRDNWGHLYAYDLRTGELQRQVTTGEWNVTDVVHIADGGRTLYVTGVGREAGRHPYYQHLYRVGLDGRGLRLLTPEDANHSIAFSPDGRFFVNTFSTPEMPPTTVLRRNDGRDVLRLEAADISRLQAAGWRAPRQITVKARDGVTDLYGLMFTPTQLDTTRRYPIVNYIYPGPWGSSVGSWSFAAAHRDHQALAELGFIVVAINGMGTELRSKEFLDFYYGNMGDNTIPDQIAGMRELAGRHPWIDIDRAGIWGHSGGGFATASAMFRHPDFFKVGVSQAGNHDNRNYVDSWSERFQGLLTRTNGGDSYEIQANQLVADNLRGRLLLAHGAMDDNVAPYNTYLVVDALIKANKDFDLIVFPHARHGFGADDSYMMRRRWDYFVRHLMGAEPPQEYRIGVRSF